ncbi:MAG: ABC transporter ATP-binding protein/permease [Afipia sp.]|nr:ABC transporter ATP-binding protein/permease [Afipia sp.]
MKRIVSALATIWRLATPYFRSEDKWAGGILLAAIVAIELGTVAIDVLINQWRNRFYTALQEYKWDVFVHEIIYFSVVAAIFIVIAILQLYLNQWLQIRWRKWLTERYLGEWLDDTTHYRMQLAGDPADNPDQRIAEDVRIFIKQFLTLSLGLLNSVVTLVSFVVILWGLSETAPLHLFGAAISIPGYLVWAALIYAIGGTILTHLIGKPLIKLDFHQQRYEADFRFNLVRARENSEQIALLKGGDAEHLRLSERLGAIIRNWHAIMIRTTKITAVTQSYAQAVQIFPYMMVAPAYFAHKTLLGGVMQAASAFLSVQGALSFFISAYRQLAEWQAVIDRLEGFEHSMATARERRRGNIRLAPEGGADGIILKNLQLASPTGTPLLVASDFTLRRHQRTLLTGPSGSGKSTLFRAIAGTWPFGAGTVSIPAGATLMSLPQRPYFPVGPLSDALAYPAMPGHFDRETLEAALADVGLPALAGQLDETGHWNQSLSPGEQQRLGIARALLHKPQFLMLDEATASLDEATEALLYRLIAQRLPDSTVVSIGHRSTLAAFHQRHVALTDHALVEQSASAPAG